MFPADVIPQRRRVIQSRCTTCCKAVKLLPRDDAILCTRSSHRHVRRDLHGIAHAKAAGTQKQPLFFDAFRTVHYIRRSIRSAPRNQPETACRRVDRTGCALEEIELALTSNLEEA